jgi:hypothetical protein
MVALNWQIRSLHAPYMTSFEGFHRPWRHVERFIQDVRVTHDRVIVKDPPCPSRGNPS